jgi:hypothetical protein
MTYTTKMWFDDVYISIAPLAGAEVNMCAKTTSLGISGGGYDMEGIKTFCGKITRLSDYEDIEISLDGIPVSNRDFDWMFHGAAATGNTITSSDRVKHRISFLWTNQTGVTAATQAISTSSEAFRRIYADAYCTSLEYNQDAGEQLTITANFKLPYEDASGVQNFKVEACDTSSALSAVAAYTGSTKF